MSDNVDFGAIDKLVRRVFTKIPQAPNSIQIEIVNGASTDDNHAVFKTLGLLLTHGVEHIYGENVQFEFINIDLMKQYIQSVGWRAIINPKSQKDHPRALPWLLRIPCGNIYYSVIFEPNV